MQNKRGALREVDWDCSSKWVGSPPVSLLSIVVLVTRQWGWFPGRNLVSTPHGDAASCTFG